MLQQNDVPQSVWTPLISECLRPVDGAQPPSGEARCSRQSGYCSPRMKAPAMMRHRTSGASA